MPHHAFFKNTPNTSTLETTTFSKHFTQYQTIVRRLCSNADYITTILEHCDLALSKPRNHNHFNDTNLFEMPGYTAEIHIANHHPVNVTLVHCLTDQLVAFLTDDAACQMKKSYLQLAAIVGVVIAIGLCLLRDFWRHPTTQPLIESDRTDTDNDAISIHSHDRASLRSSN